MLCVGQNEAIARVSAITTGALFYRSRRASRAPRPFRLDVVELQIAAPGFAITTRSIPRGSQVGSRRKHSRQRRLMRFRTTASPIFFVARRCRAATARSPTALRATSKMKCGVRTGRAVTSGRARTRRLRNRRSRPKRKRAKRAATSCRSSTVGAYGPCGGGSRGPFGRRASPCGRGSRACERGEGCGAGRCASWREGAQESTFPSEPVNTFDVAPVVCFGHFGSGTVYRTFRASHLLASCGAYLEKLGAHVRRRAFARSALASAPRIAHAQASTFHLDRLEVPGAPDDGVVMFRPVTQPDNIFYGQLGARLSVAPLRTSTLTKTQRRSSSRARTSSTRSSRFTGRRASSCSIASSRRSTFRRPRCRRARTRTTRRDV